MQWLLNSNGVQENRATNMEKVVIMMIGFLPIRSANIPQIMEVKALPNIYEAPTKVKNVGLMKFSR
jgi:hypothetical protein